MHTCADLINSVPFFLDAEPGFITSLVTHLTPEVRIHQCSLARCLMFAHARQHQ